MSKNLLIVFKDGKKKRMNDVNGYGVVGSGNLLDYCFYISSLGYSRSFIPMENVLYFGDPDLWEGE